MGIPGSAHDVVADRYALIERIGRGGAGEVWRGWDQQLQRDPRARPMTGTPPNHGLYGRHARRPDCAMSAR
jgi:hypothetical protein